MVFKKLHQKEVDLSHKAFPVCRTQKELSHRGNEGLDEIVARLANVKSLIPNISFAGEGAKL